MIAPMNKYSFWIFHKEYDHFLQQLRDIGVVHVQEKGTLEDKELTEQLKHLQRYTNAIKGLEKLETAEGKAKDAEEAIVEFEQQTQNIDLAKSEKQKVEKELKQVEAWGAFDHNRIVDLGNEGVHLHFFTAPAFDEAWKDDKQLFVISEQSSKIYFVVVSDKAEIPTIEAESVSLPQHSVGDLRNTIASLEKEIDSATSQLIQLTASIPTIQEAVKELSDNIQFTKVKLYTENIADDKAMLIEGFAPVEKEKELVAMLKTEGIYYTSEKAQSEDNVPILLKNNRFNRLFEVISDLYAKPRYDEFDLTPFLGIFYMIFFGFCLGDAGYGLIYIIAATVLKRKASESVKPIATLVQLLSLSTIIFGIAGGTFFGIELYKTGLPIYRDIAASLDGVEGSFVKDPIQNAMLIASIGLGVTQMLLGMFINGVKHAKQKGFRYSISTFSWPLLFIFSGANAAYINGTDIPFLNPIYAVLGGLSLFGIFFLNSPGKNPLVNFGSGLWDAYNNIVGGVGDLLSYIRLFALALASSILGLVFNNLGSQILTTDGGILTIILSSLGMLVIMAVGHAMNIFMSTLSSAVHPLRLTFVEFYKNAGFEGGGKAFIPFKKTV